MSINTKDTLVKLEPKAAGPQSLQILRSSTASTPPSPLTFGTPALIANNTGTICRLFIGDSGDNPREVGGTAFALLASPAFTGTPTAPTATLGTNTTQIATTAFVAAEITNSTITAGNGLQKVVNTISVLPLPLVSGTSTFAPSIDAVAAGTGVKIDNSTITYDGVTGRLKVKTDGITALEIAPNTITAAEIANGTITTTQISATADITGSQLSATAGIVGTQLANDTITATQIAPNAVNASELGAVAGNGLSGGAGAVLVVNPLSVANSSPTNAAAITVGANGVGVAVDNSTINATAGGALQVKANGITAAQIANGTITTTQISATAGITGSQLSATAGIVGTQLANNTITATQIANGTITTTQISATADITGSQLSATAGIVGTQLANDTITATQIAPNAITASELAASAVSSTGGLLGGGGTALAIKPDVTTGATVCPITIGANGAGVKVDNSSIIQSPAGTLTVNLIDCGTF